MCAIMGPLVWQSSAMPLFQHGKIQWQVIVGKCLFSQTAGHQKNRTHYETLGVGVTATPKEIKAAFVARSKKVHPDMNRNDPKLHDKFVHLNEAYSTLMKPMSRQKYDESIGAAFYKEPVFSQTNPRPYNPYHQGPPPQSMGSDKFYQDMLRKARQHHEHRGEGGPHSSPLYTFRPFILTLTGFTMVYVFFVQSNESDRHQRIKTAHELTWRKMEEQNKELLARRRQREEEQLANGETSQETAARHTHVKPVEKDKTLREIKRTMKREKALEKAKKNLSDSQKCENKSEKKV